MRNSTEDGGLFDPGNKIIMVSYVSIYKQIKLAKIDQNCACGGNPGTLAAKMLYGRNHNPRADLKII